MNAYKELRKEKVLSSDEDEFIKMLEDQLKDASRTKTDAEANVTELEKNITSAEGKVVLLEDEIKGMKDKCDVVNIEDDDDELVEYLEPRSAVYSKKRKTTEEVEKEILVVFIDNNTSLEVSHDDVDAAMLEQVDLESNV